ncbi:hypothetical protein GGX14DRAFT_405993 [Mycena pura]|uniref:Alpha-L-arabinofuranosidase B catalytic domain-containing protein n=1 Tax=Mycena pura TaxID=153505 RepID=A0AAD6UUH9_9AGAR|nr:hypothetical protein GGX14DRAFT_405993 [Mycena pura]
MINILQGGIGAGTSDETFLLAAGGPGLAFTKPHTLATGCMEQALPEERNGQVMYMLVTNRFANKHVAALITDGKAAGTFGAGFGRPRQISQELRVVLWWKLHIITAWVSIDHDDSGLDSQNLCRLKHLEIRDQLGEVPKYLLRFLRQLRLPARHPRLRSIMISQTGWFKEHELGTAVTDLDFPRALRASTAQSLVSAAVQRTRAVTGRHAYYASKTSYRGKRWGRGTFPEGVMTSGFPSEATENTVQANIIAAAYAIIGS